jgi:GGDEF domain-containing protein
VSTVSIGGAVYPVNGGNVTEVMQYADMNLYQAKRHGRNKVAMDEQIAQPTSGHAQR